MDLEICHVIIMWSGHVDGVTEGKVTQSKPLPTANRRLPTADCRLPTADRRLPTADRRFTILLDNIVTLFIFYLYIILDSQSRMCDLK